VFVQTLKSSAKKFAHAGQGGDLDMEEPREVVVTMDDRFFTIDLPIEDEKLIASVLLGLARYVNKVSPIKIKQSYVTFSGTQEVIAKLISKPQHIAEWGKETKGLISGLRKR
jgi:hypothetical protein